MSESNESHREYPKDPGATETKTKTYTVDSGDNLSAIAKQDTAGTNLSASGFGSEGRDRIGDRSAWTPRRGLWHGRALLEGS